MKLVLFTIELQVIVVLISRFASRKYNLNRNDYFRFGWQGRILSHSIQWRNSAADGLYVAAILLPKQMYVLAKVHSDEII